MSQSPQEIKSIYAQDEEGNTPLHLAAKAGNFDEVKWLIESGQIGVNAKNKAGATALHLAAEGNHLEIIQYLLTNHADINALDNNKNTPFHYAAKTGYVAALKLLKDNHADLNAVSVQGNSALHFSAINGRESATEFLLKECKLNINQRNTSDYTALHYAAKVDDEALSKKLVACLLENKADVAAQDKRGWGPLHLAVERGHLDVCKLLVDHKADINVQTINLPLAVALWNGKLDVAQWLILIGVDVNARGEFQRTALHSAAHAGDEKIVDYLLENKADTTARDEDGLTPLHLAAEKGHLGICKKLVDHKADVRARGDKGETVLGSAARMDIIKWLIEGCHVDIDAPGYCGLRALHCAVQAGDEKIVSYLLDHKADITVKDKDGFTPLHYADLEICKLLVARGAHVIAVTKWGDTPMHSAAFKGKKEVVQWFIEECCVDINMLGFSKQTALLAAANAGHLDLCKWLVGRKASINARRDDGCGLLHLVGTQEVAKWLIEECGFRVNALDANRRTPLHLVATRGDEKSTKELMEYLIEKGAYVSVQDKDGETPLHVAVKKGSVEVAKVLLKHGVRPDIRTHWKEGNQNGVWVGNDSALDLAKVGSEMWKLLKNFSVDAARANAISHIVWSRALGEGGLVIDSLQSIVEEYAGRCPLPEEEKHQEQKQAIISREQIVSGGPYETRFVIELAEEALLGFAEDLGDSSEEALDVIAGQVISLVPSPDDCITYWAQLKVQFEKDPSALRSVPRPSKPDKAASALKAEEREEKHRVPFSKAVPMNGDPDAATIFSVPQNSSGQNLGSFGLFNLSGTKKDVVLVSVKSQDEQARQAMVWASNIH